MIAFSLSKGVKETFSTFEWLQLSKKVYKKVDVGTCTTLLVLCIQKLLDSHNYSLARITSSLETPSSLSQANQVLLLQHRHSKAGYRIKSSVLTYSFCASPI